MHLLIAMEIGPAPVTWADKDERVWNDEIQKLMNEAKDDDFLAIVDCHI